MTNPLQRLAQLQAEIATLRRVIATLPQDDPRRARLYRMLLACYRESFTLYGTLLAGYETGRP